MDSFIQIQKIILDNKVYWKLVDLPHIIIQCEDTKELLEKVSPVLSDYFEEFPAEQARVLTIPEMMHIPLPM